MISDRDPLRKIPTKHAPEPQGDIGSALKAARLKKGHSLEAVSQQTRIPKKYLDALEANRFEEFPALAYLRGFLKNYCDYLELDFEPLWRLATSEPAPAAPEPTAPPPATLAAPAAPATPAASAAPAPKPEAQAKPSKPAPAKKASAAKHAAAPAKHEPAALTAPTPAAASHDGHPTHSDSHGAGAGSSATGTAASLVLLAGILGILAAFWILHGKAHTPSQPASATPVELQRFTPRTEATLTLQLRGEAWLSIAVDGKPRFEGNAPQGSRQDLKMSQAVTIRTSTPDALKLTLNGAPLKLPAPDASGTYRIEAP